MWKRTLPLAVLAAALLALLIYSQFRPEQNVVSGILEADEIRVGSRVGGRVARVLVAEGESVSAGQELIGLEPFDLRQKLRQAEAEVAAHEADLQRLEAGFRIEEIRQREEVVRQAEARLQDLVDGPRPQELAAARGRIEVAKAELELADRVYQRTARLVERDASAQEDLDRAVETLHAAQAQLTVRQQELSLLEAGTRPEQIAAARAALAEAQESFKLAQQGYRVEEVKAARASRDAAQAAADALSVQLEELTIRSPSDAVVEALDLQPGDMVAPGAPVLTLADAGTLWVRTYVPENRLDLQLGQHLEVTVDSFPNRRFTGRVQFVARQGEFMPSNVQTPEERVKQVFRVKVELTEGLDVLRAGMAADVWLNHPKSGNADN